MIAPFITAPGDLADLLLTGSFGRLHLLRLVKAALEERHAAPAAWFQVAAWEHAPLDCRAARQILTLAGHMSPFPFSEALRALWKRLAALNAPPPRPCADPLRRLAALPKAIAARPRALELWSELDALAPFDGASDTCMRLLGDHWPQDFPELRPLLAARFSLYRGDGPEALNLLSEAACFAGCPLYEQMYVQALRLTGQDDAALQRLARILAVQPWQTNALLQAYDMARGRDNAAAPLESVCVLMFSFNKCADLERTLQSLADSDAARLPCHVLDNGSTDATWDMLTRFQQSGRLPHLSPLRLPTNIGAPAARNWLLTMERVRNARYAVFLDDDIALDADWLARLGAAVRAYPDAGAWGCKIRDFHNPAATQSTDLHIMRGRDDTPFTISDLHLQGADFGQFHYMRPCASVTGCCHLFPTRALLDAGGFDIRFTPTQFDDLDRDLRDALAGRHAVYTGFATVRHRKRSGGRERDPIAGGNARGNQTKLFAKFSPPKVRTLLEAQRQWLRDDLLRKSAWLKRNVGPGMPPAA